MASIVDKAKGAVEAVSAIANIAASGGLNFSGILDPDEQSCRQRKEHYQRIPECGALVGRSVLLMSLAPALSMTLGNLRYDTHAAGASICLAMLPRGNSADMALPSTVRFEASIGDKAVVSLDGGEGAQTVLTGKVHAIRREFEFIRVIMSDIGDLAGYRPSATLEGQDAQSVVNKLASDVSLSTNDVDIDLDLAVYVAHPGRTAAEHIAKLAELSGGIAYSDGDGSLNVKQKPSGPADSALKYGREVISYQTRSAGALSAQRFAMGFGPAGSGGADDALRPSVDAIPGSASDGGAGVWRVPTPVLRVPSAATTASGALQGIAAAQAERVTAHCFLLPAAAAGKRDRSAGAARRTIERPMAHHASRAQLRAGFRHNQILGRDRIGRIVVGRRTAGRCRRCDRRSAVSTALLFDGIARIARHEAAARPVASVGVVTSIYGNDGTTPDHAVSVKLRESGLRSAARAHRSWRFWSGGDSVGWRAGAWYLSRGRLQRSGGDWTPLPSRPESSQARRAADRIAPAVGQRRSRS